MENSTTYLKDVEDRIISVLKVYPRISPSMLHIGIGSSMPTKIWRPVLEDMVSRGIISIDHIADLSAKGRSQSHTIISLKETVNDG